MFSGQTLLRKEIINKINEIDNENINILEIGGNDKNKNLFKNAKYYSLGYEADINIDLNADFTNKFDIQFDYIIISTTMMYMNNVNNFLLNSLSYMTKNSKIIIMEVFIYPQTNHKNIYDTNRLTYEFVINFLTSKNYQIIKAKRIGGIFSSILLLFIDLFPSIINLFSSPNLRKWQKLMNFIFIGSWWVNFIEFLVFCSKSFLPGVLNVLIK